MKLEGSEQGGKRRVSRSFGSRRSSSNIPPPEPMSPLSPSAFHPRFAPVLESPEDGWKNTTSATLLSQDALKSDDKETGTLENEVPTRKLPTTKPSMISMSMNISMTKEQATETFMAMDSNETGVLDRGKFLDGAETFLKLEQGEAKEVFSRLSQDGSVTVDVERFATFFRVRPKRLPPKRKVPEKMQMGSTTLKNLPTVPEGSCGMIEDGIWEVFSRPLNVRGTTREDKLSSRAKLANAVVNIMSRYYR